MEMWQEILHAKSPTDINIVGKSMRVNLCIREINTAQLRGPSHCRGNILLNTNAILDNLSGASVLACLEREWLCDGYVEAVQTALAFESVVIDGLVSDEMTPRNNFHRAQALGSW
jgi:hypothetical protein